MKLPNNNIIFELLALLIMTTRVAFIDAECLFCINATIVDPTLEVAGGETCASLSEAAASLEADEFLCADVALAAQVDCCPSSFNVTAVDLGSEINPTFNETVTSCSICADGLTVSDDTVVPFAEANGSTCAETLALALNVLDSSTMCTSMKNAESICCPEPSSNPCQVCAEGITVDGATPIFDGAVKTCADVVVDALTVEEGSDLCAQMKVSEVICCNANATTAVNGTESSSPPSSDAPTTSPSLNGTMDSTTTPTTTANNNETTTSTNNITTTCEVCIDGIASGTNNIVIGNGKTCGDLISDAAITDANDVGCSMMQDAQLTCCPTPAQVPCDVCASGITVMEDTAITVAKTCGDLMVDALNTELDSDICSGMKAVAEPICCPANSTAAPTTAPENNSTTTTTPTTTEVPSSSSATTLAPSSSTAADVMESLSPSTATSSSSESSASSSSTTTSPTVLGVTTPSPSSLMTTSTTDALPASLAPTAGLEPNDKEPLAFEAQGSGGEAPSSSSSRSGFSYSSSPQSVVGFFAIIGCAMAVV